MWLSNIGLEQMLRIYFLQQWYALVDEALEDTIYDSQAMRDFIGIDAVTGLTHSVVATSANVADVTLSGQLIREDDTRVYSDAGYLDMGKYLGEEKDAPDSRCCVAAKRGAIKKMEDSPMKTLLQTKASIRTKVEHPLHVLKKLFGYRKARYKGLAKNQAQLFSLFALTNAQVIERFYLGVPIKREMGELETFYSNDKAKRQVGFAPRDSWRDELGQ